MPIIMQCPFFKRDGVLRSDGSMKLYCEGGTMRFPDAKSRRDYIISYCANTVHWRRCTVCRCLEDYYERKEKSK